MLWPQLCLSRARRALLNLLHLLNLLCGLLVVWARQPLPLHSALSVARLRALCSPFSVLRSPTLLAALTLLLTAAPLPAAVPQFSENVACEPIRIRLPKGVEATPTPPLESYRFMSQKPDGSVRLRHRV